MERIGHLAKNHAEALAWEIDQMRQMTPDERRSIAKALRERVYGTDCPDVRSVYAGVKRFRRPR